MNSRATGSQTLTLFQEASAACDPPKPNINQEPAAKRGRDLASLESVESVESSCQAEKPNLG